MTISERDEPFDWSALVPHVVHPLKVAIIEASSWIDRPLSATDLTKLVDDGRLGLSHVSYHVLRLADAGILEKVNQRQVRDSTGKPYVLAPRR
jgi:DNA-binding transcriptional ArsR family regulator